MSDPARKTALFILNTLNTKHKTLDQVLDDTLRKNSFLSRKDRALIHALVYGVLRWQGRLDWIIAYFSKTRLDKIDFEVLNILRLGLFQIIYLSRTPVSAAVNTSVEMSKSVSAPWVVQYVNGLLRNAARKYRLVPFPDMTKDPVSALAVNKSFPKWLVRRWLDRFGLEETGLLCDSINTIPPITLRANTLKTSRKKLVKFLEGDAEKIGLTDHSPDGISLFNPKTSIPELEAFKNGLFQVQDEAAQLVTMALNPKPGDTVLDACAGLGGKTGHIAQRMRNRGKLLAVDNNAKKLSQLEKEMRRLGVSMVTTRVFDLSLPLEINRFGTFDKILLDAPCTGLGVLRRNPDAKWKTKKQNLSYYNKRQSLLLENLSPLVRVNGILAYAVCSMEPEENEAVVKGFLNKHSEFVIESDTMTSGLKGSSLLDSDGYLRTFAHRNNTDCFFSACLKRIK
jgi:16S rRNA (cytosine967-C5)-methyltransferase